MEMSFEEVLSRKQFLHQEILSSLKDEHFKDLDPNANEWDVKLVINGIECEPFLLNDIWNNLEKYVDREAKLLLANKYEEVQSKIRNIDNQLSDIISNLED